eukprot:TRINITY_DN5239_c0_g1_i4.p1 TRINITY_DN5239_c0_g1~~TRINITY_DN5239_c0_g1_i4.p1  ORF type:complete len:298 (+),score=45.52 TRINITY_DN5239_c0_g1_i4:47-940(+)
MLSTKRTIEYGDTVIMYGGFQNINMVTLEEGKMFDNKRGHFGHDSIVGKKYGDKIDSRSGAVSGSLTVLPVSSGLWTLSCQRRTEILYVPDISLILLRLELQPGSIVVESGTGTGSLSTHILNAIANTGHLYTFEFHKQRAEAAEKTFKQHKMDHLVTVTCRDVCKDGFGLEEGVSNAAFLDLPSPWLAISSAKKILKQCGSLCSFSPCIEQVQKTCEAMRENNFSDITTIECLERPWDVSVTYFSNPTENPPKQKNNLPKKRKRVLNRKEGVLVMKPVVEVRGHTGYLTFAQKKSL